MLPSVSIGPGIPGFAPRDLSGRKFGAWTALEIRPKVKGAHREWLCRCACGRERALRAAYLLDGRSASCGCIRNTRVGRESRRHGRSRTPEYTSWTQMWSRCSAPSFPNWHRYGGRGIKVCARWRDFAAFLADMGERPSRDHSIDRIDNDGNYEPGNCRWATRREQGANRSTCKAVTIAGDTLIIAHWAHRLGVHPATLRERARRWERARASA